MRLLWIIALVFAVLLAAALMWVGRAQARPMVMGPDGEMITPPCCLVEWQYCAGRFVLAAYLEAKAKEAQMTTCQGCGERVMQDEPGFVRRDHPDLPFFCYGCNQAYERGELRRLEGMGWIRVAPRE